jgi:hypothetical protein
MATTYSDTGVGKRECCLFCIVISSDPCDRCSGLLEGICFVIRHVFFAIDMNLCRRAVAQIPKAITAQTSTQLSHTRDSS